MGDSPTGTIKFDYIKGNFFRAARADGAWAGTNGYSDVVLSFFSERTPIPTQTVHALTEAHTLGDELISERKGRNAIIREVEICLSMSLDTAKSIAALIVKHVEAIESGKAATTSEPSDDVGTTHIEESK
jgi:hypothetical protein